MNRSDGLNIRKNDIIIVVVILLVSVLAAAYNMFHSEGGAIVVISCDGNIINELPLDEDTSVTVPYNGHYNTIVIEDCMVRVTDADCPDRICVNHHSIGNSGDTIVCLPHKLVIEVKD